MKDKYLTIAVIAILLVLIIAFLFLSGKPAEEPRKEEVARAPEPKPSVVVEKPAEEAPAEVTPTEPVEPVEPVKTVEPIIPLPPSTAGCKADPAPLVKQRAAMAPKGMLYIPGGSFSMGSPAEAGYPDESPVHAVCVTGFYIDKHEVTNAEFKEFVEATGHVTDAEKAASPDVPTWRHPYGPESDAEQMPNYPVVCVSWNDANAYALWAGKRLPTEAEWEKAARGTDGRIYPWGNAAPTAVSANIADKSGAFKWSDAALDDTYKTASPVGSFPAGRSVYGVEDMAGNVWEWCFDWWKKDYYRASPSQNPSGPDTGEFKVIRGGSWFYSADGIRTTHRMYFRPAGNGAAIGFRCVKDVG